MSEQCEGESKKCEVVIETCKRLVSEQTVNQVMSDRPSYVKRLRRGLS